MGIEMLTKEELFDLIKEYEKCFASIYGLLLGSYSAKKQLGIDDEVITIIIDKIKRASCYVKKMTEVPIDE